MSEKNKNNFVQFDEMAATISSSTINNKKISVSEFYNGKTVFITGGTGFMGKVLLEKLLRSCSGLNKIYLLIRPKKGQDAHERLKSLMCSPLFDSIRKLRPNDINKVLPIEGDITQPELAISLNDRTILERNVNIVFHSAATVKFDEKLKLSVTINMLGTQRLVELCKRMDNLEALVHVSTAYCNCDRNDVEEIIYPSLIGPNQITSLVDCLDENLLDSITNKLINNRPNTYTFTKALAECWLKNNKDNLPLVIVRPTIVLSCINEPIKGWVDNLNGPTGIIAASGKGIFRSMLCEPNKIADLIPVDMVINLMICSAWDIGINYNNKNNNNNNNKKQYYNNTIPIYNCSTGVRNSITWKQFIDLSFKYMRKYPITQITWYPDGCVTTSKTINFINHLLLQWLPAYLIDFTLWITGGKPIMLKVQDKLTKAATCLEYFTTKEWHFNDENVKLLNLCLNDNDRKEFCFDVTKINWNEYIEDYILGIRQFIFKEGPNTLLTARKSLQKLYWINKLLQFIIVITTWYFLTKRCLNLKNLWGNALKIIVHLARMLPFV